MNRRKRSIVNKLFFSILFLAVFAGLLAGTKHLVKKVVIKIAEQPTVYMVHGDIDTCVKAKNVQGMHISCTEAMKDGNYHIEWNAPKTRNEE